MRWANLYFKEWEISPPLEVFAAMFAGIYTSWKPPAAPVRKQETNVPAYRSVVEEFNRRMEALTRPRQLAEEPAGPSVSDVLAEFEKRTNG